MHGYWAYGNKAYFQTVCLPCKQENGCFDQATWHHKILCEIKKIESGNNHFVERLSKMKLCMIRPFADGIEHLQMEDSAEIEHPGGRLRTVITNVNINISGNCRRLSFES